MSNDQSTFAHLQPIWFDAPDGQRHEARFMRYLQNRPERAVIQLQIPVRHRPKLRVVERTVNIASLRDRRVPGLTLSAMSRRYIGQAVHTYPFLSGLADGLLGCNCAPRPWSLAFLSDLEREEIVNAVLSGKPLLPRLTRALGVPPWVLKRFRLLAWPLWDRYQGDTRAALAIFRELTPEWAPSTPRELNYYRGLEAAVGGRFSMKTSEHAPLIKSLLGNPQQAGRVLRFTRFVEALRHWLKTRGAQIEGHPVDWLGVESLTDWIAIANRWQQFIDKRSARPWSVVRRDSSPDPVTWAAIIAGPVTIDDFLFVGLASRDALIAESAAMRNCVRSYSPAAVMGRTHLVSVRHAPDAKPVATVEVHHDNASFSLNYAAGPCNARLRHSALHAAIETFIAKLNDPAGIAVDLESQQDKDRTEQALDWLVGLEYSVADNLNRHADHFDAVLRVEGRSAVAEYIDVLRPASAASVQLLRLPINEELDEQSVFRIKTPSRF